MLRRVAPMINSVMPVLMQVCALRPRAAAVLVTYLIAFSVIFDLARDINRESSNGLNVASAQNLLLELAKVLGITLETDSSKSDGDIAPYLDLLLEVREGLRKERQFELSDRIRDRLVEMGVSIEDTATGARWKLD